jgi:hypothetical protein
MLESLEARGFQIEFHSHATAILSVDFPDAVSELEKAIGEMSIPVEELIGSGGGETNPCPLLLIGLPASIVRFGENLDVEAIASGDETAAL